MMLKKFFFTEDQMDSIYEFIYIAQDVAETREEKTMLQEILKSIDSQTDYSVSNSNENVTLQTVAAIHRIDEALKGLTTDDFDYVVNQLQSLLEKSKKIEEITHEMND